MALNALGLGFVFTAKNFASAQMNRVKKDFLTLDKVSSASMKRMQGAMKKGAAGLAALGVGAIGLKIADKMGDQFGKFEYGLAKVGAITRISGEELDSLKRKAIAAGLATKFSPEESVEGLRQLGLRGFTATESMSALDASLAFAQAADIGVGQAAKTAGAAIRVFGLEAGEAEGAVDRLLRISNLTAIEAGDLELMLGTVSRGAAGTKQSLDEMLASMGLMKNTGVDASVAASSVSSALQFLSKNQDKFKKLGVNVTDPATGGFRDFLDIVQDVDGELMNITDEAKRNAKSLELFGRFGQSAFIGISTQIKTGIRDQAGQLLKGDEAIAYLRTQMAHADGAADEFQDKILNTFEGQKQLLTGSVETLGIMIGESFATGLRPIVEHLRDALNILITVIQATPKPLRDLIGKMFVFASATLVVVGAVLAIKAALMLAGVAIAALGITLGGALVAAAPFLVAIAGIVLIAKAFETAFAFIPGLSESFDEGGKSIKLFISALDQLFSKGALSGDTLEGMLDPKNSGVREFFKMVAKVKSRVEGFAEGIRAGFGSVIQKAAPLFNAFKNALHAVAEGFGFLMQSAGGAGTTVNGAVSVGVKLGDVFGQVAKVLVFLGTGVMNVFAGMMKGVGVLLRVLNPAFKAIGNAVMTVVQTFGKIFEAFGLGSKVGSDFGGIMQLIGGLIVAFTTYGLVPMINTFAFFANILAGVIRFLGGFVELTVHVFKAIIHAVQGIFALLTGDTEGFKEHFSEAFMEIGRAILAPFKGLFDAVSGIFDAMLDYVADIILQLPEAFVPDGMVKFATNHANATPDIPTVSSTGALKTQPMDPTAGAVAIAADQQAKKGDKLSESEAQAEFTRLLHESYQRQSKRPIVVHTTVKLDNEKVATGVSKGNAARAAGSFGADTSGEED